MLQSTAMPRFQNGMNFLYCIGWSLARIHYSIYHRLNVIGIENIPLTGGAIIAANHVSHLDPPALGASFPRRIRFVAKQELWDSKFLGWYFTAIGLIPIKRGSSSGGEMLNHAADAVKSGSLVAFFPEGTRSKSGYPRKARSGVIVLAALTGAPVIPVRISGTYDCMPPKTKFPHPGKIQAVIGKPITWAPGELDTGNRRQMTSEAQKVLDTIISLPGWHPLKATPPDKAKPVGETQLPESEPD